MIEIKKKLLFLTSHLPYPLLSGGRLREYELVKRLCNKFEVTLIAITNTYDNDIKNIYNLEKFCTKVKLFKSNRSDFKNFKTEKNLPEQMIRNMNDEATILIRELVNKDLFDMIHLEGFYMMQHIEQDIKIPLMLVEQNIEFQLWEQRYLKEKDNKKKEYYLDQSRLTKKIELEAWRKADIVGALTIDDKQVMDLEIHSEKTVLVPNGFDHLIDFKTLDYNIQPMSIQSPSALIVGNFSYFPNVDAVKFFIKNVYKQLIKLVPEINIYIVGNNGDVALQNYRELKGIAITGRVESIEPYYRMCDVFICPLKIGGGIKVKMLEAISFGIPIVTTNVGAQGLKFGTTYPFIICEDDDSMAVKIQELICSPDKKKELSKKCSDYSKKLPSWDEASYVLERIYFRLIEEKNEKYNYKKT